MQKWYHGASLEKLNAFGCLLSSGKSFTLFPFYLSTFRLQSATHKEISICSINKVKLWEHSTPDLSCSRIRLQPGVLSLYPLMINTPKIPQWQFWYVLGWGERKLFQLFFSYPCWEKKKKEFRFSLLPLAEILYRCLFCGLQYVTYRGL